MTVRGYKPGPKLKARLRDGRTLEARKAARRPRTEPTRYIAIDKKGVLGTVHAPYRDRDTALAHAKGRWPEAHSVEVVAWGQALAAERHIAARKDAYLAELLEPQEVFCVACRSHPEFSMRREFASTWECGCRGVPF
jgi:hypothetical protein